MLTHCVIHIKVLPMAAIVVHRAAIVLPSGLFCGIAWQEVRDRRNPGNFHYIKQFSK